ncbi:hypothetical protein FMZ60_00500 [Alcaligenaceae bacterium SJ-26]|nr:hypothetical protein FMZ60_00500 [Alcaligenaceae bacterium SJ-26]
MNTQGRRSLLGAGMLLSLALMAGRLAGFGREMLLASSLGLSAQADVAIVLLTIPDLLVNLLLSGGIGIALIPAMRAADGRHAAALFWQSTLVVGGVFTLIGLGFAMSPELWFRVLAPGLDNIGKMLEGGVSYAMAVAIPLTALAGVTTAALNARDRFFVAGSGTLIFNLCVIGGLMLAFLFEGEYLIWLCAGILAGTVLRWLSQWAAMMHVGLLGKRLGNLNCGWLLDVAMIKSFAAGLAAASLLILVPVVLRAAASWLGAGEMAAFNYAIKLVELPLAILITTLATVAFPRLSEAHSKKDSVGFDRFLQHGLRRSIVLSCAVILCGWPFVDSAVALLFGMGRIDQAGLAHIATLTQVALLSVPWAGISGLAAAALNARLQPVRVLRRTLSVMLILPLLCLPGLWLHDARLLMWALPGFHLILAFNLAWAAGGVCLRPGLLSSRTILAGLLAMILVAVLASIFDVLVIAPIGDWSPGAIEFWRVGLAGLSFFVVAGVGLYALRCSEQSQEK